MFHIHDTIQLKHWPTCKCDERSHFFICNTVGFEDAGQQQIAMYEDANFKAKLENLWTAIEPIYKHLHSYVRRRLVSHYGTRRVRVDGPIPAHLLGKSLSAILSFIQSE